MSGGTKIHKSKSAHSAEFLERKVKASDSRLTERCMTLLANEKYIMERERRGTGLLCDSMCELTDLVC